MRFESATTAASAALAAALGSPALARAAPRLWRALTLSGRTHRAPGCRGIGIDQFEVDLPLRQVDSIESHPHRVAQLPARAGALPDQAHAARLEFPIISGNRRDVHQAINGHFL